MAKKKLTHKKAKSKPSHERTVSKLGGKRPSDNVQKIAPILPFRLLYLPQEIIDMIYIQMLRAGYINILCASKETYARASQFIRDNTICRMIAGQYKEIRLDSCILYSAGNLRAKSITDIEIRIPPSHVTLELHWLPSNLLDIPGVTRTRPVAVRTSSGAVPSWYGGSTYLDRLIHRRSCHIFIETTNVEEVRRFSDRDSDMHVALVEFEDVTFACPSHPKRHSLRSSSKSKEPLGLAHGERQEMYKIVREGFKKHLGPAVWVGEELRFRPWGFNQAEREGTFGPDKQWECDCWSKA